MKTGHAQQLGENKTQKAFWGNNKYSDNNKKSFDEITRERCAAIVQADGEAYKSFLWRPVIYPVLFNLSVRQLENSST